MIRHDATNSLVFEVDDPFAIRERIRQSRVIDHPSFNIAVQHTQSTVEALCTMGIEAPSPMLHAYDWPGQYKPFAHQRVMADFLVKHKRAFNLSEMGVGKSAASLWAADYLMRSGAVKKAVILAPLSVVERVWEQDIFTVLMHRTAVVVHGSKAKRDKALAADVDFYIINHDGICTSGMADELRKRADINLVIVDEASIYRNGSTKRYKALQQMLRSDQRVWLLTGTPCPNAPTDAWSLAKLVSPERVPKFFGVFRLQTMYEVSKFRWVPKTDGYETAFEVLQPATRFKKADCLDLPPVTTRDYEATTSDEQDSLYEEMKKEMAAEYDSGFITAANAADRVNKLRQILCGVIRDTETGEYVVLDHTERADLLVELIGQASAKVLVVVPFKGVIRELEKVVSKHYSCAVLNGDVPPKQRNKIIEQFKSEPDPHVLLCHPKVMAHGLNLTEADTLIFYAPIYSNDEFQQVTERFNRTGQTRKMTIARMYSNSLEKQIYAVVDGRKASQDGMLDLFKSAIGASV